MIITLILVLIPTLSIALYMSNQYSTYKMKQDLDRAWAALKDEM